MQNVNIARTVMKMG